MKRRPIEAMPIEIYGKRYLNAKFAAAALGVTPGRIYQIINSGTGSLPRKPKGKSAAKPFSYGAYTWPSRIAAAAALGVSKSRFHSACGRADWIEKKIAEMEARK